MKEKRYKALYLNPGFCDGFSDSETGEYLTDEQIEELLNKANEYELDFKKQYRELIDEKYNLDEAVELLLNFIKSDDKILKQFCIWLIK